MKQDQLIRITAALFLLLSLASRAQTYLSPCATTCSKDGSTLFITGTTGSKLLQFDTAAQSIKNELILPAPLSGIALSADEKTSYVTGGVADGRIFVCDNETATLSRTIEVGHSPVAPVLSPDGKTIYICNRFDNDISFVDLASGKTTARVNVRREPIAADITPDGKFLYIANHIPDGPADADYVASKISVIDTATKEVTTIPLVNGAEGVRGIKASPDGQFIYATHFMARFLVPTTQLERGWVSTDALSVIRVADKTLQYTVLLDDVDRGFANPWAIGISGDANTLVVSAAGSHEISLINLPELTKKIDAQATTNDGKAHLNAHNNLSFLSGIRQRIPLKGFGPRSLAVHGNTAYVANYFSDNLNIIDLTNPTNIIALPLGPEQPLTAEREGELFFNSAELCFQQWLSCATCHPDGRNDALNWDLLNDGIGNPKNVKTMLLAHETPKAMSLGVRADAETAVRAGLRYIQFAVRPESDALKIDAYLKSMKPLPSPHLVDGKLSPKAERGKILFKTASCIKCHPAPLYTDLQLHEVGTPKGQDTGRAVDTPCLIECWRTAPYLHDGRAESIEILLKSFNHANMKTAEMTDAERSDLAEYILSL